MIDSYSFGSISIDGRRYTSDVIIFPDRVDDTWWREEGHLLQPIDIEEIIKEKPDVLIVGTGRYGRLVVQERAKKYVESNDIELIVGKTGEVCGIYNEVSKTRKVVAALHLTC